VNTGRNVKSSCDEDAGFDAKSVAVEDAAAERQREIRMQEEAVERPATGSLSTSVSAIIVLRGFPSEILLICLKLPQAMKRSNLSGYAYMLRTFMLMVQ